MGLFLNVVLQVIGCYILYSASDRAVFLKRRHNHYFYQQQKLSRAAGALLLVVSTTLFIMNLGIGVGSLFALISLMSVSGCMIMLLPLQKIR